MGKALESLLASVDAWVPEEHDPGPMARLECVKADVNVPSVVFQRLSDGETLKDIGKAWQVPVGGFTRWYSEEHAGLYDAALKVRADQLAHEAVSIADTTQLGVRTKTTEDGVETVEEDMLGHRKLQVDTRLKLAEKWDRARYGAKDSGGGGGVTVLIDRSCGGTVQIEAPGGSSLRIENSSTEASGKIIEGESANGDHDSRTAS